MQSVPISITINVAGSNPANGVVYSIQHYVIKFVSDLIQHHVIKFVSDLIQHYVIKFVSDLIQHYVIKFVSDLIQHYVIKFVSDLRKFGGFFRVFQFAPTIKLTSTI